MSEEIETTLGEEVEPEEVQAEEPAGEEETPTPGEGSEEVEGDTTVEGLKQAAIAERKKRQAVEAELEQLKQAAKPPEPAQQPTNQQETIEDMYLRDPRGTTDMINAEIAKLAEDDPYANAVQIERLRDLKTDLRETAKVKVDEKVTGFTKQVHEAIPDFAAKRDLLTKFAVENLGYTAEDLARVTNFNVVGEKAALSTIKLINQQYDMLTAPTKKTTKAPEPINPAAGNRNTPPNTEPDPDKEPEAWIAWERARVAKLGRRY